MKRRDYTYDIETIINAFCLVAIECRSTKEHVFVIHELRNDLDKLLEFLDTNIKNGDWHVGFNNVSFDAQVVQYIIDSRKELKDKTAEEIAHFIYEKSQDLIGKSSMEEFSYFDEKGLQIRQLDLFRILGYQNPSKRTSLKWCEYAMDFSNIQEMPISHSTFIKTQDELDTIVSYCRNDVLATKRLMELSKSEIGLRKDITDKYGINCYNLSDVKIGSELLLDLYCKKTGRKKWDVRKISTKRDKIALKDVILPYIQFESQEFKGLFNTVKDAVVTEAKGDFKYSQFFKNFKFDYGKGGLHGILHSGVFESNEELLITTLDISGMYPNIAVVNNMYPAHLGSEFSEVYKNDIVDVRLAEKAKKEGKNMAIVEGLKLAGNGTFGNSNNKFSWLFDRMFTYKITVNGQLLLTMLIEKLMLGLPDSTLLMVNTDGIELVIKRKDLDKYYSLCKEWEIATKLTIEFDTYSKVFLRDCNNYIGLYTNGKVKCKGAYEWEDLDKHKSTLLHKNKSFLIIPKAVYNFFINNISPEKSLEENTNIFDYCGGVKGKGEWKLKATCVIDGIVVTKDLQKVTRYYISKKGSKFIKNNQADGRKIQVVAGKYMQTEYNKHDPNKLWDTYDIDKEFYLDKIYKEISNIKATGAVQQLQMF